MSGVCSVGVLVSPFAFVHAAGESPRYPDLARPERTLRHYTTGYFAKGARTVELTELRVFLVPRSPWYSWTLS